MQALCLEFFKPDKFSGPHPKWQEASPNDVPTIKTILQTHYPQLSRSIKFIQQSGGKEVNSNNFRVKTESEKFIVKRSALNKNKKSTETQQLSLATWLHERGLPIPRIHLSGEEELCVEDSNYLWCVLEYIEGNYFEGTNEELVDAAVNLGRLYGMLREGQSTFTITESIEVPGKASYEFLEDLRGRHTEWSQLFGDIGTSVLDSRWQVIIESMEEVLTLTDGFAQERALCHVDFHPHNLLLQDGQVKAIIDFGSFKQAAVPVTLAFNAFKLLRQSIATLQPTITESAMAHRRDLFLSHLPKEYSLHHRHQLAVLAKAEILRRLLAILCGATEWKSDIPVHADALIEAECLFS